MFSFSKLSFVLGVAVVASSPQFASAQDAYADCTCRTAQGLYPQGVGNVVFANGGVMVDNASASPGNALSVGSFMDVGAGSAEIVVGSACAITVPANSQVSISQPGGPGSDLCVKVSTDAGFAQAPAAAGDNSGLVALGVIGGGAALAIGLRGDDDDGKKKKRKKVST